MDSMSVWNGGGGFVRPQKRGLPDWTSSAEQPDVPQRLCFEPSIGSRGVARDPDAYRKRGCGQASAGLGPFSVRTDRRGVTVWCVQLTRVVYGGAGHPVALHTRLPD